MRLFIILGGGKTNLQNSNVGNKIPPIFLVIGSSYYVLSFNGSVLDETCILFAQYYFTLCKKIIAATLTIAVFQVIMTLPVWYNNAD